MSDVEGRLGELERRVTNLETVNEPEQPAQHLPAGAVELDPGDVSAAPSEPEAKQFGSGGLTNIRTSGFGVTGSTPAGSDDTATAGTVTPASPEADRPPSTEGL